MVLHGMQNIGVTSLHTVDNIGDVHTYGCFFEMSCALHNALTVKRLPSDLDRKEEAEAESMLHVLTRCISEDSEQCLRWIECAIVVNYPPMPEGFQMRPLALKMLSIGEMWQHLHTYEAENYTTSGELAVNL